MITLNILKDMMLHKAELLSSVAERLDKDGKKLDPIEKETISEVLAGTVRETTLQLAFEVFTGDTRRAKHTLEEISDIIRIAEEI